MRLSNHHHGLIGWLLPTALLLGAASAGCVVEPLDYKWSGSDPDTPLEGGGEGGAGGGDGSMVGGASPGDGLPCDVEALLVASCTSCHAAGNIPPALETYADLLAPSTPDPTRTVAEWSLDTMIGYDVVMPPAGLLPQSDIDVFQGWVDAGLPPGECGAGGGGGSGAGGAGTFEVVCTSDQYWQGGDSGSSNMDPGEPCIGCHQAENEGPDFNVAGTVYPTFHEPDDCYGASQATVEIIDADGRTYELTSNAAGNFSMKDDDAHPLTFPILARVLVGGDVREKQVAVGQGDCNSCHTESGANGAPGRITLP